MDRETFARHLRDLLAHLYDAAFLQTSPLADRLLPAGTATPLVPGLRLLLRQAIEALRPPLSVPFSQPEWFSYRVLWEHYVQRKSPLVICDELALSRTSYYRYQQQALEALADMLARQQAGTALEPEATVDEVSPDEASPGEAAIREAVKLAHSSRRQHVVPARLLAEVRQTLAALAQQRGVAVTLSVEPSLLGVYADPAMLRQIVVSLCVGAMERLGASRLDLSAAQRGAQVAWCLRIGLPSPAGPREPLASVPEFALAARLLGAYHGSMQTEDDESGMRVRWSLPAVEPRRILVVDDDEDTIVLYRRYLQAEGYNVQVASSGDQVVRSVEAFRPDLIILDVLMPREDGWLVLQRLKTLPETADIPVVVYSVLSQPSLALSLGAAAVLLKPVEEEPLLAAVARELTRSPSPA